MTDDRKQVTSMNEMDAAQKVKKAIETATLAMLIVVPIIFSTHLYNAFSVIKLGSFVLLLLFMIPLASYLYLQGSQEHEWRNPLAICAVGYLCINLLCTITSVNLPVSADTVFILLSLVVAYFVWTTSLRRSSTRKYFLAICAAGFLTSLYALLQHGGRDFPGITWDHPELVRERAISTFGNPTFLAGYLVMVIPITMYFLFETRDEATPVDSGIKNGMLFTGKPIIGKALFTMVWVLCILALFLSSTRGAWVAFILSSLFFIAAGWKRLDAGFRRNVIMVSIIFIILISLCFSVLCVTKNEFALVKRIIALRDINDIYTNRIFLWRIALLNFRDNPLLGTGPGTYPYIFPRYRYVEPVSNRGKVAMPEACHNEFLEVASSTGILGLLSLISIIFTLFYLGMKLVRKSSHNEALKWICVLSSCIAYLTYNFTLYPTISSDLLWWFFLSLISAEFTRPPTARPSQSIALPQKILLTLVITVSLMSGVINIRIIWGNYLIRLAKDYETEKRWKDSYIAFNEAILCDSRNYRYYQFRGKMLEGLFREKPLKNVPEEVIRSYKTSIELNKLDSYCWADLGRFLGYMTENYNRAMFSEAEKAYQKAIGLDPYNPLFYNDLANLYAQLGKDERALEFYQKGYELYPQSSTINVNLAVYYMGRKDFHSARIHLEKVLEIEPENKKALKLLEELTKNEEKEKHESHK